VNDRELSPLWHPDIWPSGNLLPDELTELR